MTDLFRKINNRCDKIAPYITCKGKNREEDISDIIPEGFRANIIVSDKNETYTIFLTNTSCKVAHGFSSSQLNLTATLQTWNNIFLGKDRIIKGIMEKRIKLRGIRPMMSQLMLLSSLIYIGTMDLD
ncbi:MAG: hypothetical protein GF329_13005 [Candidatus Lokiarchaeota archaeon]|nr:hypothetical protein [Candidatus Lokiarchaeota archaeon]